MAHPLIRRRNQIMERADRACDTAWPARTKPEFVIETLSCVREMELLSMQMRTEDLDTAEQSRTFRLLGALFADLEPARGREMLTKAVEAYTVAEELLLGQDDELERAILNFNYANALRQLDPNDIRRLEEAKQRFLASRGYFATNAPEFLEQIDSGLQSVAALLRIAPLAATVARNSLDIEELGTELARGGDAERIAAKMHEVMGREGGVAGLIGHLKNLVEGFFGDKKQSDEYAVLMSQVEALGGQALGEKLSDADKSEVLVALRQRFETECSQGRLTKERADTVTELLKLIERRFTPEENESLPAIMERLQGVRKLADGWLEALHYLSHGLPRPPVGSRAATLVELCWQLRRFLAEEMNRSGKGPDESKAALELSMRASNVDKRLYEVAEDDDRADVIERDELRPLALAIRDFSARHKTMLARPIWSTTKVPVATNEVFCSASGDLMQNLSQITHQLGLQLQTPARGESLAGARWLQLQKAMTTIFDLRAESGPTLASVTYELGIALTLGKPVIVLIEPHRSMPFDVDVVPLVLTDSSAELASAIDRSLVWLYPGIDGRNVVATIDYALTSNPRPHANLYADQTLKLLLEQRDAADPVAVGRTLEKLVDFIDDNKPMLIHPVWPPVYPAVNARRLFHVMPFRPDWADDVTETARAAVRTSGGDYVRGDEVEDPNVIRAIWVEIARASHVLVDLTGFNPNVALELGIAHTLGRKVHMVCQGEPNASVFPSISKLRIDSYDVKKLNETLAVQVKAFVST